MASGMTVPEHLNPYGVDVRRARHQSLSSYEGSRIREQMRVPDRIQVAGGETNYGGRADPTEVMADRVQLPVQTPGHEVPALLTAADWNQPEIVHETDNRYSNESSIAIDEDPLKELKLMRRQIKWLSEHVRQMENVHKNQNQALWCTLAAVIVSFSVAVLFVRRR